MRELKLTVVSFLALLLVAGCSSNLDKFGKNDEYLNKNGSKSKSISVPRDLNGEAIENYYPVPEPRTKNTRSTSETLAIPPGSDVYK